MSRELTRRQNNESTLIDEERMMAKRARGGRDMSPHRVRGGVRGVMKGSLAKETAAKTNGRRQKRRNRRRG